MQNANFQKGSALPNSKELSYLEISLQIKCSHSTQQSTKPSGKATTSHRGLNLFSHYLTGSSTVFPRPPHLFYKPENFCAMKASSQPFLNPASTQLYKPPNTPHTRTLLLFLSIFQRYFFFFSLTLNIRRFLSYILYTTCMLISPY